MAPQKRSRLSLAVAFACLAMTLPDAARPASFTWDGGGTNNNWSTLANWTSASAPPADGDIVTFDGALRTSPFNDLTTNPAIDQLRFFTSASAFTLGGNAFTIRRVIAGLGGSITNLSTTLQRVNNPVTFDGFTGINSQTGTLGPITLGGPITFVNNASVAIASGSGTITFNGTIAGNGGFSMSAPLVQFNAPTSYNGQTAISGTLRAGAANVFSSASSFNLQPAAVLDLNSFSQTVGGLSGGGTITLGIGNLQIANGSASSSSGAISGSGKVTKTGAGTQTLTGSNVNTWSGGTEVLAGTLELGQFVSNVLPDGGSVLVQGGTLSNRTSATEVVGAMVLDGGSILGGSFQGTSYELRSGNLSSTLTGNLGVQKTTAGTVVISGGQSYTGATGISGGTLRLGASNALPDGTNVTLASGTTLDMASFSDTVASVVMPNGSITGTTGVLSATGSITAEAGVITAALGGSGSLVKNGTGTLNLGGSTASTYTGATVVNAGTLDVASSGIGDGSAVSVASGAVLRVANETIGSLSGAGSVQITSGNLTVGGSSTTTFSGVISGSAGLIRQGTGRLVLSGANTYTGQTQVNAGTLALGANHALADASTLRIAGGVFDVGSFADVVAGVTLVSGTVQGTTGKLATNGSFAVESGAVNGELGGTGSLVKSTAGVVVLGSQSTYSGSTFVNAGTLQFSVPNALPALSAVTVGAGATLDLNGKSGVVGSLAGSGSVQLGFGATLDAGGNGQSTTFSGTLSGAPDLSGGGGLQKNGFGTLVFSGTYQHAGRIQIDAGTLDLPNGLSNSGTQPIIVEGVGTLSAKGFVNRAVTTTAGSGVTATGNLILGDFTGARGVSIMGALNVGNHLVQLVDLTGAAVLGGPVSLAQGGVLTALDQNAGFVLQAGGTVSASGSASINGNFVNLGLVRGPSAPSQTLVFTDDVSGTGSFAGNVRFTDTVSPGLSPALVAMENAVFDGAEVLMELGGTVAGSGYDKFQLSGLLDIRGGLLKVALIDGFAPRGGDSFDLFDWGVLQGSFSALDLPQLSQGLHWQTSSLYVDGSIAVAVPEPESYAMLLAGLSLLGFRIARRKR